MNQDGNHSILAVCSLLTKYDVQYLLVGGIAVGLNGYERLSLNEAGEIAEKVDIDIWYNPTYPKYFKLLEVIEALGCDVSTFKEEMAPNARESFFRLEFERYKLDLLPYIASQIKFSEAYQR